MNGSESRIDFIKINDSNQSVNLRATKNTLRFKSVTDYFPQASGLTFTLNNEKCGLEIIDGTVQLMPGIKEYNVHYPNIKTKFQDEAKEKRKREILAVIHGDGVPPKLNTQKNEATPKKFKKSLNAKKSVDKVIYIGWKHRDSNSEKFRQMPIGEKKLILQMTTDYSFEDIKEKAINTVKNKLNCSYFENSYVTIGTFQEKIFFDFYDESGKKVDFWSFSQVIKSLNNSIRLYVFTTATEQSSLSKSPMKNTELHHSFDTTRDDFDTANFPKVKLHKKKTDSDVKESTSVSNVPEVTSEKPQNESNIEIRTNVSNAGIHYSVKRSILDSLNVLKKPATIVQFTKDGSPELKVQNADCAKREESKIGDNDDLNISEKQFENLNFSIPFINKKDIIVMNTVLGEGSFGKATKGLWRYSEVAVKQIKIFAEHKSILREISVMEKLRHPNIINIMAVAIDTYNCYIVMEYYQGHNLRQALIDREISKKYLINLDAKNSIGFQIIGAVTFIHEAGIAHKDIKLDNVLVNKDYKIKICDFGLSRPKELPCALQTTVGQHIKGTAIYMAPEILNNEPGWQPADVWAVSCLLIEMYNGGRLWKDPSNIKNLAGNIDLMKRTIEEYKMPELTYVPVILRNYLTKCFILDPNKRAKIQKLYKAYLNLGKST